MATTSNFGLTLLEIGQKNKEITINENLQLIDSRVPKYLGELATNPTSTGVPAGSTYYNTTTSKLMFLKANGTWVNAA
jgi:hypothetical protein